MTSIDQNVLNLVFGVCFGYINGALLMSIPLILQGLKSLQKTYDSNVVLTNILYVLFALISLITMIIIIPSIIGKLPFEVTDAGWVIASLSFTFTVLVIAKILVHLNLFKSAD